MNRADRRPGPRLRPLPLLLLGLGCAGEKAAPAELDPWAALEDPALRALIVAMGAPRGPAIDETNVWSEIPEAQRLGQALFFDPRLSGDGQVSCASCHDPALGWADGAPLPVLEGRARAGRHTPSVLNTGLQRWQLWDGRCDSLWCQAAGPIENPDEMNLGRADLGRLLADDPALGAAYLEVFGLAEELAALPPAEGAAGGLPELTDPARFPPGARPRPEAPESAEHLAYAAMAPADQRAVTRLLVDLSQAIAAFEGQLVSGEAPIDRYVAALQAGDRAAAVEALPAPAARGLLHFVTDGQCALCHTGPLLSNLEFEAVGLGPRDWLDPADPGRAVGAATVIAAEFNALSSWSAAPEGEAAERLRALRVEAGLLGHFKVPPLRELSRTAPYMHGGHLQTLAEVVHHYNELDELQTTGLPSPLLQPLGWSPEEEADVVAFLETLSAGPTANERALSGPPSPHPYAAPEPRP